MSWSNQSGGGGNGPWGKPGGSGRGGGGNGTSPPNLEDLIKTSQDRLKNAMPGGGGSAFIVPLVVVGLAFFWLFNSIYTVDEQERGQELIFGKPKNTISLPGLHFHWWPFETAEKVLIVERTESIGSLGPRGQSDGLMLSGDQNFVDVDFAVLWEVSDPKKFLFNVRQPDSLVRKVAEAAMREIVGRRPADDVFRDDKVGIETEVKERIQSTLDFYEAGVVINALTLQRVDPPAEVADAFEEVQRAEQDEDRFKREADAYANKRLGEANGRASEIREQAAAYKNQTVKLAEGESQRFISILKEYEVAKDVTKTRLFLETMEKVLGRTKMVIIDEKSGDGIVPYLPLDQLNRNKTSN